ncbi:type II and III secretion system protein family protein [Desulfotalea psychrophila]|uniref:Uncharacterized protein n=1 Tax=Desulfotalea psychrophila (strain LSv54 / DSM 12343) TaxID=177439 RepID=Q6AN10_DESPS|nr:pilus assembly protein N-terminal domain-containing protein [Desulfotalea psychrophila]CAG36264.1 conserved hypothetical protein [Desulfotalea psychrophila LSv54]
MLSVCNFVRMLTVSICCLLVMGGGPFAAESEATVLINTKPGEPVQLTINRLAKLRSSEVIRRAHIVNPDIAELIYSKTQSPAWVFVSGKSIGTTQLTLWGARNKILGTFEIIVRPDVLGLKKHIHDVFPGENVSVRDSGDFLTLTGTVAGAVRLQKILALAEAYAPSKVINLLKVGGIQQVMLEVRIAEISKRVGNQLGINFGLDGSSGFGLSMLDGLSGLPGGTLPIEPARVLDGLNIGSGVNAVFGKSGSYIVAIDALQEDGLVKVLAKPTLIAQSGQSASFLAGGEFPFPVAQQFDRFSIEWKPFGVGLNFTPTVLGEGRISLLVSPEVSDLDFTNTISYAGYVVPSIETRRMSTVVELNDNQSFAIAGLMKNNIRESIKKFPLLGDIPILGVLFRSSKYIKNETELVVVVTPHLVTPVDGDELSLPTDSFVEPTAFELLVLGMLEGKEKQTYVENASATGANSLPLEGDFGYIVPE